MSVMSAVRCARPVTAWWATAFVLVAGCTGSAPAGDWPMWGCDAGRTGACPTVLADELHLHWVRALPPPRPAWPPQGDNMDKLDFDLSYSPVVMGERVFVGSMTTDSLTAYGIDDGAEQWRFYADGPVRLAPAAGDGKVYFASDDGHLYCLDAETGRLVWKFRGAPAGHRVLGNERLISMWPARGGPVLHDGTVYFTAGIWPFLGIFVYALDAETGEIVWSNTGEGTNWQPQPHGGAFAFAGAAPQGYLAVGGDRLVVSGGRSLPALYDRRNGTLLLSQAQAKPLGGYRVQADAEFYYNHGRKYRLEDGKSVGEGALRDEALRDRAAELAGQLDGDLFEALAAHERLFLVTKKGTLYCFGAGKRKPAIHAYSPTTIPPCSDVWSERVEKEIAARGEPGGYALLLGAGSGRLLEELLARTQLHVVVVEPDADRVEPLRQRLTEAGLYGSRAAVHAGDPATFALPPYVFSVIAGEEPWLRREATSAREALAKVFEHLRPYDGTAYLPVEDDDADELAEWAAGSGIEGLDASSEHDYVRLVRKGPLPGAGEWTHQYADSANTMLSRDERVRLPLGILWFGGPSNAHVLPRHAAGPRPQVAGGRLVILGVETLSARDVYTGRELWVREFPGIGHPFTDLELEAQYWRGTSVYMTNKPGATYIGSPLVTLPDSVYLRHRGRVLRLDPETGETLAEFDLYPDADADAAAANAAANATTATADPAAEDEAATDGPDEDDEDNAEADDAPDPAADSPDWGHVSVLDDLLIATAEPQVFDELPLGERNWNATSSRRLIVMDRFSGKVLWSRQAAVGFRHNAVVSAAGKIFIVDGLSEEAAKQLQRRGADSKPAATLLALDAQRGEVLWKTAGNVFGTRLSYSTEHDVLLEGGSQDGRRVLADEPSGLVARRGSDGTLLWRRPKGFVSPAPIRGVEVIPGRAGTAVHLLTGENLTREHPLTGQATAWSYWRSYGCNTVNASSHLLLFRTGSAGFADLETNAGTGTFGGFKSGCTASMIAADGVLNAPDYTRTCTCSYQNQTSLAMIHMPDMDIWTANRISRGVGPVRRLGINLGAPGNRRAEDGTLWVEFPPSGAPSPDVGVRVSPGNVARFRSHSLLIDAGGGLPWVAASGVEGATRIDVTLDADEEPPQKCYCVRLHFAEPDRRVAAGERLFDVSLQGSRVLRRFDVAGEAGGALRPVVREFKGVVAAGTLRIDLRASTAGGRPPILCGIEVVRTD